MDNEIGKVINDFMKMDVNEMIPRFSVGTLRCVPWRLGNFALVVRTFPAAMVVPVKKHWVYNRNTNFEFIKNSPF